MTIGDVRLWASTATGRSTGDEKGYDEAWPGVYAGTGNAEAARTVASTPNN